MGEAGPNNEVSALAARIVASQGDGLFAAMAQYLAAIMQADEVLIGEAPDGLGARTLGVCIGGAVQPNYTFPLAGTPCEALLRPAVAEDGGAGQPLDGAATAGPSPPDSGSGYFGLALHAADGGAIGFVCARSEQPLNLSENQHCLVEIVAVLLGTVLKLQRTERERGSLETQVHRLRAQLESLERGEVAAAATGTHRMPAFAAAPINLDDNEATGLHHVQREHILRVLNATRWVIEGNSGAALKLGMKPATLRHRMKKLGIARLRQP
jgi:hypothetical protein